VLRWIDPKPVDIPLDLNAAVGGHPLLAETLVRRHVETAEAACRFLDPSAYTPADAGDLPDLPLAAERLRLALQRGERIAIWGDFDADGQTATALLLEALRALGADVVFHIPGRDEGHGVHMAGIDRLSAAGTRLIVTCDTGVTAHASLAHARSQGVDVIVTDHHVPDEQLPPAVAVINPHRLPPGHPMSTLSGVAVAFELVRALQPEAADRSLDLVALGLVADVATLVGDARYLVQRGLEHLRHTGRPGLQAVCQSAELRPEGITEEHVAFVLAPRLNALGRLADAALGVELLTTDDLVRARVLAAEVEGLNSRRQWLTRQVLDAALAQIERQPSLLTDYAVLVLSFPTWPVGIIGIVAGRLAERFRKPAVLVAAPPGELGSGSGRSVPGIDLVAALRDSATHLQRFGGHAGAAGFGIQSERIPDFRVSLSRAIETQARALPEPTLQIDAYVRLSDLTLELVSSTSRLAPFGPGNPPLALAVCDIRIATEATMGRASEHRRLVVEDADGSTQTVFWWHGAGWPLPQSLFDLALIARASDYRGEAEVQTEWLDARLHDAETIVVPAAPAIAVQDCRAPSDASAVLERLDSEGDLQLWAEGPHALAGLRPGQQAGARHQLAPGPGLAVWTLPPGPRELSAVLTIVQPQEVFFFASDPGLSMSGPFLSYLAGLVKYALRAFDGRVELVSAAVATAHRISTVKAGIEWLAAQGQVAIVDRGSDAWKLAVGTGRVDGAAAQGAAGRLDALLSETAAYRDYLRNVPEETLSAHVSGAADRTED
jgi:single-stranded-DNA-specific exonuclease